jgi:monoamine oxidase
MGFCYAATSSYYLTLSSHQRQLAVTQQYQYAFQSDLALFPLSYTECDWTAEEFSKGCYSAVMPPRVMTEVGEGLRLTVGRMHWAGTELAVEWSGYMSGAVESGERAAHEVLLALGENMVKGDFVLDEQGTGGGCTKQGTVDDQ